MRIVWDSERTRVNTETLYLTIETGMSVVARNMIQALKLRDPVVGAKVFDALLELGGKMTPIVDRASFITPDIYLFKAATPYGDKVFVYVSAFVPDGGRRGKQQTGSFRMVIVTPDEVGDALVSVFNLEKFIERAIAA